VLTKWNKGKSEADTNEKRMDDIKDHPEHDELKGLSQTMAEDREVGK